MRFKQILLLCLLSIALCTSGCVKYSYHMELDNKGNITLTETDMMNLTLIESMDEEMAKSAINEMNTKKNDFANNDYSVEDYNEGAFTGMKMQKKFKVTKFTNNDLPLGFTSAYDTPVDIKKTFYKTTYSIKLKFDSKELSKKLSNTEKTLNFGGSVMNSIAGPDSESTPVMELKIKLPTTAQEQNSDEISGTNEYKWSLIAEKPVEIFVKYENINWFNIILAVIAVIAAFFFIIAANDKDTTNDFSRHF